MTASPATLFRAALIADSLCLGSHWIYNQDKVKRLYPEGISEYRDPKSSYHPNRKKGQFTHFGDQMVILAKAMAASRQWSRPVFQALWQSEMTSYDGYLDGASKSTLEHLANSAENPASDSDDLSGASRFVPVMFQPQASLEDKIRAAREQTALTHGAAVVIDSAEFFVRATEALLEGTALPEALTQAASHPYQDLAAKDFLQQATEALTNEDFFAVAANFGLTCHHAEAFPSTLYFALRWHEAGAGRSEADFLTALSENGLAGGDNAARAIPLAVLLAAAGCQVPQNLWEGLAAQSSLANLEAALIPNRTTSQKVTFTGANGDQLDARLEIPAVPPRGYALFAHCFTCGKASRAANEISRELAAKGFATLRFDFTGLGNSEGDFANTSFLSNVEDLVAAAQHLRTHFAAPTLIIGHSLGGAAVLAAAGDIPELTHVATLGAPYDPAHVTHLFEDQISQIEKEGQAEVSLAGRKFQIGQRFLSDLEGHRQEERIAALKPNLLIMHAPTDDIVGIENAGQIYSAARHPKSFLALAEADHLLTDPAQARYAAHLIASWIQ